MTLRAMLKKFHFYFGLAVILHFIITGLLMRRVFWGVEHDDLLGRMMFRANHIYILFSGLLNLLLSYTLNDRANDSKLKYMASFILVLATLGLSLGFYTDPITHTLQRNITRFSVIGCLAGTAVHLLLLQFRKNKL